MTDEELDLDAWERKHNLRKAPKRFKESDLMPCPECGQRRICKECKQRITRVVRRVQATTGSR